MRQSSRLLLNTGVSYARMIITVPIGILVTRFVFNALGEVDYGLFATLAASGVILSILNTALVESAQRNLAFAIGEGGGPRTSQVFRAVLALFGLVGPAVLAAGLVIAPVVLAGVNIPEDRLATSWWVLHFTILTIALNTLTTPYRSLLNAHQEMPLLAAIEVLNQLANLTIALLLTRVGGDQLLWYSFLLLMLGVWSAVWTVGAALRRHPESRVGPWGASRSDLAQVTDFAGWVIARQLANLFRNRGALLIAGAVFTPTVTAGYGLALRAHDYLYRLAQGFSVATKPVANMKAGQDRDDLLELVAITTNKYSVLMAALLWTPLVLETDTVLRLWLGKPGPPGTAVFLRLFCSMAFIGISSWGSSHILQAKNQIRPIALLAMLVNGACLAACWAGCELGGWPPWAIPAAMMTTTALLAGVATPWIASRQIKRGYFAWMWDGPVLAACVVALAAAPAVAAHWLMPEGALRLVVVTAANGAALAAAGWRLALTADERELLERVVGRLVQKFNRAPE